MDGTNPAQVELRTRRVISLLELFYSVDQEVTRRHDCLIAGNKMLVFSVNNWPHAFLYRVVLQIYAVNAGEGFSPLNLPVNTPVVISVSHLAKIRSQLSDIPSIAAIKFKFFLFGERVAAIAPH